MSSEEIWNDPGQSKQQYLASLVDVNNGSNLGDSISRLRQLLMVRPEASPINGQQPNAVRWVDWLG